MSQEIEKAVENAFKNSELVKRIERIEQEISQRKSQENYRKFILQRKKSLKTSMNPDLNNGSE